MKRMIDNKEFNTLKSDVNDIKTTINGLIEDSTTSESKVWSSSKVNTEIGKAKDKGIYYALEEPTENEGVYTYAKLTLANINPNIPLKVGDLIISFDDTDLSNIKSSNMWRIDDLTNEDYPIVVLVGKVGGSSKQLYQHNIDVKGLSMQFINDVSTAYTSGALRNYIKDLGLNATNKLMKCDGILSYNSHKYLIKGVCCSGTLYTFVGWDLADYTAVYNLAFATDNVNVDDTPTAL